MNYCKKGDVEGLKKHLAQYIPEDHAKELLDGICVIARKSAKYYAETGQLLEEDQNVRYRVSNSLQYLPK